MQRCRVESAVSTHWGVRLCFKCVCLERNLYAKPPVCSRIMGGFLPGQSVGKGLRWIVHRGADPYNGPLDVLQKTSKRLNRKEFAMALTKSARLAIKKDETDDVTAFSLTVPSNALS